MELPTKNQMYSYYFDDPIKGPFIKELSNARLDYYYLQKTVKIELGPNQVANICLLKGQAMLKRSNEHYRLNQFDMVYLPQNEQVFISSTTNGRLDTKICIVTTSILSNLETRNFPVFEIQRYSDAIFVPRGELSDTKKMATFRKVWTAFKNGFFMSGFTEIPKEALVQGVVTSVNVEEKNNNIQIFPHIHPDNPEIYIFCIDDPLKTVAVSQFLINKKGESIVKDLTDGDGLFFDGSLGHMNFIKPTYRSLKYCMYMWIIPTFGKTQVVEPKTMYLY